MHQAAILKPLLQLLLPSAPLSKAHSISQKIKYQLKKKTPKPKNQNPQTKNNPII